MHDAVARELRLFQAGDHAKHAALLGEGEVGLEPDEVVAGAVGVLGAQLQSRPRAAPRARIGEPHRLQGAEARGVAARPGYLLDGLAGLEQLAGLEVLGDDALGREKLLDEGVVLLPGERGVQIVSAGTGVLVAALAEHLPKVDGIRHHHRRRSVVEGQGVSPRQGHKRR